MDVDAVVEVDVPVLELVGVEGDDGLRRLLVGEQARRDEAEVADGGGQRAWRAGAERGERGARAVGASKQPRDEAGRAGETSGRAGLESRGVPVSWAPKSCS